MERIVDIVLRIWFFGDLVGIVVVVFWVLQVVPPKVPPGEAVLDYVTRPQKILFYTVIISFALLVGLMLISVAVTLYLSATPEQYPFYWFCLKTGLGAIGVGLVSDTAWRKLAGASKAVWEFIWLVDYGLIFSFTYLLAGQEIATTAVLSFVLLLPATIGHSLSIYLTPSLDKLLRKAKVVH